MTLKYLVETKSEFVSKIIPIFVFLLGGYCRAQVVVPDVSVPLVTLSPVTPEFYEDELSTSYFAYPDEVLISFLDSTAFREDYSDGTTFWSVAFHADGALSMNILFSDVNIHPSAELSVYSPASHTSYVVDVQDNGWANSEIVAGEDIVVRYVGPTNPAPHFCIRSVCKGFRHVESVSQDFFNKATPGAYGSSASCNVPASCSTLVPDLARAACRLIINGTWLGSAMLINNTRADYDPLILTSAHVLDRLPLKTCKALFGFSEPLCRQTYVNKGIQTISGATIVAFDETSDMAVLRLSEAPSNLCMPYWAGWSRSSAPQGPFVCFHHAYGDALKVSTASSVTMGESYTAGRTANSNKAFRSSFHWLVSRWDNGTTQSGSSGSALLDASGRVIGALTGGLATCANPVDDYFWQLGKAWTLPIDSVVSGTAPLSEVLDPIGSNVMFIDGLEYTSPQCTIQHINNFVPTTDSVYSTTTATLNTSSLVITQPILATSDCYLNSLVIYSHSVFCEKTGDDGPQFSVCVSNTYPTSDSVFYADMLRVFNADNVVELEAQTSTKLSKGLNYISLSVSNLSTNDYLRLPTIPTTTTDEECHLTTGGSTVALANQKIMLTLNVCSLPDSATIKVCSRNITMKVYDNCVHVSADRIAQVSFFDRSGRLFGQYDYDGLDEVAVPTIAWARGLYIARVRYSQGVESFKILVR